MPKVDNVCDLYSSYYDEWKKTMVVLDGESSIKAAAETYLPRLGGQLQGEYDAYKARGSFFNATNRVLQGLTGVVIRKPAQLELPDDLMDMVKDMTNDGLSFDELLKAVIDDDLSYGFLGCLVDMPVNGGSEAMPYVALYQCFDILNWRTYIDKSGRRKLNFLVLREQIDELTDDIFVVNTKEQYRVCLLDEDGYWMVQMYEERASEFVAEGKIFVQVGDDIYPMIAGRKMNYIPFVFFNTLGNAPYPEKSLLVDVVNLNIKHWQVSVDYYHGLHWCALPTPWFAGFPKEAQLTIGSSKGICSEDPNAKAGMLEFTGAGIAAIEKSLDKIERQMAVIGARMLEEQKRSAEVAETLKIRASGDTASLATVVNGIETGMEMIFKYLARWKKISEEDINITLNKDFLPERLSSADVLAYLKSYIGGAMSLDTFLHNLKEGEIIPGDRTIEEEKELIMASDARPFTSEQDLELGGEEEEEEEVAEEL